jgi:hypothetical protein
MRNNTMDLDKVRTMSPKKRFIYWIQERYLIYKLKKGGRPREEWTDDPILSEFRFCNVVRKDDRVSRWLLTNWYRKHRNHDNMLLACTLARHFNLPNTLSAVEFPSRWNPDKVASKIEQMREDGAKVFNSAYVITGKNTGQPNKIRSVVFTVCDSIYNFPPQEEAFETVEGAVETLCEYQNIGTFMAGQIVADMVWATDYPFRDKKVWAAIGPGSRRGMNRYHDRPVKSPLTQSAFVPELKKLIKEVKPKLPKELTKKMLAIDYQNCLCEFDKYERALWGEGRPKKRYTPHKGEE